MKLSTQQLLKIEAFIKQKGITYVDVQMEVLDHLASAVEHKMTENENLEFQTALQQTHASFGIFGLSTISDSITEGLGKKYRNFFWKHFLSCFVKYLPFTLLAGVFFYKVQALFSNVDDFFFVFLVAMILLFGCGVFFLACNKKYNKFLVYKIASLYLNFFGSFLTVFSFVMRRKTSVTIFNIDSNFLLFTLVLVILCAYIFSAIKTVNAGIAECQKLMQKHNLYKAVLAASN